ncbi:MAG: hypothetical protein Q4Q53_05320 [Methanocorpusculum sp.]|nr:hypothetical protein [Methanocorpusculum sp.]
MKLPSRYLPKFLRPEEDTLSSSQSVGILVAVGFSVALAVMVCIFLVQFANSDIFFAKILGVTVNSIEFGLLKLTFVSGTGISDLENVEFYLGGVKLDQLHATDDKYTIGSSLYYQAPENMRGTSQSVSVMATFKGNINQEIYKGTVSVTS